MSLTLSKGLIAAAHLVVRDYGVIGAVALMSAAAVFFAALAAVCVP